MLWKEEIERSHKKSCSTERKDWASDISAEFGTQRHQPWCQWKPRSPWGGNDHIMEGFVGHGIVFGYHPEGVLDLGVGTFYDWTLLIPSRWVEWTVLLWTVAHPSIQGWKYFIMRFVLFILRWYTFWYNGAWVTALSEGNNYLYPNTRLLGTDPFSRPFLEGRIKQCSMLFPSPHLKGTYPVQVSFSMCSSVASSIINLVC